MLYSLVLMFFNISVAQTHLQYLMEIRPAYKQICSDCRFEFSEIRVSSSLKEGLEKAKVNTDSLKWGRSFLLPLEIEGKNVGWVSGQVKILKLGLRALRALPQGQTLKGEDFRPDWIDITLAKDQLAQIEDLKGVDARRFLSVRDSLMKSDLKKSQLVSRGQIINVTTGSEAFTVSTQMKAEEAGGFGDIIRVKSNENQKVLSVRLQDDGSGRFE
jgi:flagella basal body P-ring formation protein FlgA